MTALALLLPLLFAPLDEADDQYQVIVGLSNKKMFEMVVDEAQTFLRRHPDHERADHTRYRLGSALFELGRQKEAAPHFRKLLVIAGFEFEAEAAFRLGECELAVERHDQAISSFKRVLGLKKAYLHLPARFFMSEALFQKGDHAAAERAYRTVAAADRKGEYSRDTRYGIAWCAYRLKEYDRALAAIDEFRRNHPGDALAAELQFLAGECHLESGRPKQALSAYRTVKEGPFADAALRGSAFALVEMKEHAAAARQFQALFENHPDSRFAAEALMQSGVQHLQAGNAKQAVKVLSGRRAGDTAELLYWRSRARAEAGDPEGALADVESALAKKPEAELKERCQVARGDLLFDLGRTEDAARAYGQSKSDYALHSAAVASLNDGRFDDARTMAVRFLKQYPDSPYLAQTHLVLGECLLEAGDHGRAAQQFEQAIENGEDRELRVRALSRMSWCMFLAEDMEGAARGFRGVVEAGKDEAIRAEREEALFMLGRTLESGGRTADAVAAWELFLRDYPEGARRPEVLIGLSRLSPDDRATAHLEQLLDGHADHDAAPEALFSLAERLNQAGEREQAERRYRQLVKRFPEHELAGPAHYGLAWCLFEREQYKESAATLRALLERRGLANELKSSGLELLVFAEQKSGNGAGAASAFGRFREVCSAEDRLLATGRAAADALKAGGRLDDADALWRGLSGSGAGSSLSRKARIESAYLELEQGDVAAAEKQIRDAARSGPTDADLAEASFYVAEALFEAGQDAKAVPLYDLAANTEGSPVIDRAHYKAGFARMRTDDLAGAAQCFARLVEEQGKSPLKGEALFLLGEMNYRLNRFDQAIAALSRLRSDHPRHDVLPKGLFRLGLSLCQKKRWQEGEETLTELVRRNPKFEQMAEAELWRGRALMARGNARGARQAFDRVIAMDRSVLSARARLELGRLHYDGGDAEKALSEFLKVSILYGQEAEVAEGLFLAGLCLEKIGDRARARSQYEEIVNKYPRSTFAGDARKRLDELNAF